MARRVVFVRWLNVTTRVARSFRVAVWRRVPLARPQNNDVWSGPERVAIAEMMRRG